MLKNILLLLWVTFTLFSCGKSYHVEKDKYPNIPKFPKFENNQLKLTKIDEVIFDLEPNHMGAYFQKRFIIKDSMLAVVIFITDQGNTRNPQKNDPYLVNLSVINGDKIISTQRSDYDFRLNFKIDSLTNDIIVGKTKYFAKSNYLKIDSIPNLKTDDFFDPYGKFEYDDIVFYKAELLDKIVYNTETKIDGVQNSPIFGLKNVPSFLYYYKIKTKGKEGLTKMDNKLLPEIVTVKDNLYYVEDPVKLSDNQNKINIYKIE